MEHLECRLQRLSPGDVRRRALGKPRPAVCGTSNALCVVLLTECGMSPEKSRTELTTTSVTSDFAVLCCTAPVGRR